MKKIKSENKILGRLSMMPIISHVIAFRDMMKNTHFHNQEMKK